MGYNQHQSFFLRERWLGKGLRSVNSDANFFFKKDAFEKVGLGKNMVQSLRHWINAFNLVDLEGTGKERSHTLNYLGEWVLKNDPTITYFDTAAILHYLLVHRDEPSSTWYWFFNLYNESTTNREDMFGELKQWVQEREKRVISEKSIIRDIDCLIKMYTATGNPDDPEDLSASPFTKLNLLKETNGVIRKTEPKIPVESNFFIKFILTHYSNKDEQFEISLEDILNKEGLIGKTFNVSRSQMIDLLVELQKDPKYTLQFTRTNNLDMVMVPRMTLKELLESHS